MRKILAILLLGLVLAPVGCVTIPLAPWAAPEHKQVAVEKEAFAPTPPPPVVLPEQVTAENRQDMLKALRAELDYEQNRDKR